MSRLTINPVKLQAALGCTRGRDLLLPALMLDGPAWGSPILVEEDDRGASAVLCRDIERGNVEAANLTEFAVGSEEPLADGAIVAVALQWALAHVGLASEDVAIVTRDGAVPLSV